MDTIQESLRKNGEIESKELEKGRDIDMQATFNHRRRGSSEGGGRKIKFEESLRGGGKMMMTEDKKEGFEFRNPSALLTHMIGRIAKEGVGNSDKRKNRK